jgi:hypothetical protein
MAKRRRRQRGAQWAAIVALAAIAAFTLWYLSARRAEAPAPPASVPGARVLGEPPHEEEIAPADKQELERILRERGGGPDR